MAADAYRSRWFARRRGSALADARLSDLGLLLLFNLLLFETYLQVTVSSAFSWLDEIGTVVLVLMAVSRYMAGCRDGARGLPVPGFAPALALFLGLGVLGTFAYGIQTEPYPVLVDLFTCGKGLLSMACALYAFGGVREGREALARLLLAECKLITLVMFVGALLNLFVDVGMSSTSMRYGLRPFSFVFYHPGAVNPVAAALAAVVIALDRKNPAPWAMMLAFCMACTLRSRGFGEAGVVVLVLLTVLRQTGGRGLRWWHVALMAAAVALLGWSQLDAYYGEGAEQSARSLLTTTALAIAGEYFPLGSGLATYGSAMTAATRYYSPLYYEHGLNTVWGLASDSSYSFVMDTFWPTVLGQFGFLGLGLLLLLVFLLYRAWYRAAREAGPAQFSAVLVVLAYLLIATTSDSSFFGPSCVLLALAMGLALAGNAALSKGAQMCQEEI